MTKREVGICADCGHEWVFRDGMPETKRCAKCGAMRGSINVETMYGEDELEEYRRDAWEQGRRQGKTEGHEEGKQEVEEQTVEMAQMKFERRKEDLKRQLKVEIAGEALDHARQNYEDEIKNLEQRVEVQTRRNRELRAILEQEIGLAGVEVAAVEDGIETKLTDLSNIWQDAENRGKVKALRSLV